MEEYNGPTDSITTEQNALFEPPADGASGAENLPSKDPSDVTESQRHCTFCRRRISLDDPTTHSEVTAWVRGPKKDSSVLREYTGRNACGDCITKLRAGISPDAKDFETLLSEEPEKSSVEVHIFTDRSPGYIKGYGDGRTNTVPFPDVDSSEVTDYYLGWSDGADAREQEAIASILAGSSNTERPTGEASVPDSA